MHSLCEFYRTLSHCSEGRGEHSQHCCCSQNNPRIQSHKHVWKKMQNCHELICLFVIRTNNKNFLGKLFKNLCNVNKWPCLPECFCVGCKDVCQEDRASSNNLALIIVVVSWKFKNKFKLIIHSQPSICTNQNWPSALWLVLSVWGAEEGWVGTLW